MSLICSRCGRATCRIHIWNLVCYANTNTPPRPEFRYMLFGLDENTFGLQYLCVCRLHAWNSGHWLQALSIDIQFPLRFQTWQSALTLQHHRHNVGWWVAPSCQAEGAIVYGTGCLHQECYSDVPPTLCFGEFSSVEATDHFDSPILFYAFETCVCLYLFICLVCSTYEALHGWCLSVAECVHLSGRGAALLNVTWQKMCFISDNVMGLACASQHHQ
jgi:hypothetical protein